MPRPVMSLMLVGLLTLCSAIGLDAQRGSGRAGAGAGAPAGSSGFRGRVNLPPAPIPPSTGMSISRPIGTGITGVQTNPAPGFGPAQRSPFAARPGTYTRLHPFGVYSIPYGAGSGYGIGYDVPPYGYANVPETTYEKLYRTPEPIITEGMLLIDATPVTAHVFVDSAYVGTVEDLQSRGLTLSAGRHWLDIEAPNYERKTVEVTIRAGEPLRYRFDLLPVRPAQAVAAPRPAQTLYMIAGCYAGNRPPVAANLPTGCDVAKVRVIPPQAALGSRVR